MGSSAETGGRLEVVAAENFWGSIAAQLGGDKVTVQSIIANPDLPNRRLQRGLRRMVCASQGPLASCNTSPAALVDGAGKLFKTPGLRTLGESAPYLHTGDKDQIEDVVRFYVSMSGLARSG